MVHPSSDESKNGKGSRYALVMAVAKRAKQLREGAPKLVESKSRNPITIALEEIAAGKLKIVIPTPEELEAASREIAVIRPKPTETAELLKIPEQEEEPVEAAAAEAESVEGVSSEASSESEEPEEAVVSTQTDEQTQIVADSGEEELAQGEEPVEAESLEVALAEALTEAEVSAEADEEQTEEVEE